MSDPSTDSAAPSVTAAVPTAVSTVGGVAGPLGQMPTGPTIDHASYLGASDIGVVLGENHLSRDASHVYGEKKGLLHFDGTVETDLGNELERPALAVWAKWQEAELEFPGTLLHPDEQWAGATVDAIRDDTIAVEFKLVGRHQAPEWGPEHLGADGVPETVVCQVHWQAWILRANGFPIERAQVVGLFGTEFRTYDVEINEALIGALVDRGRTWWDRYVVGNERPEGRAGRELVTIIHPANVRKHLDEMTDVVRGLAVAYDVARTKEKTGKLAKEALGTMICDSIADGSGFEAEGGKYKVTWKLGKTGVRTLRVTVKEG